MSLDKTFPFEIVSIGLITGSKDAVISALKTVNAYNEDVRRDIALDIGYVAWCTRSKEAVIAASEAIKEYFDVSEISAYKEVGTVSKTIAKKISETIAEVAYNIRDKEITIKTSKVLKEYSSMPKVSDEIAYIIESIAMDGYPIEEEKRNIEAVCDTYLNKTVKRTIEKAYFIDHDISKDIASEIGYTGWGAENKDILSEFVETINAYLSDLKTTNLIAAKYISSKIGYITREPDYRNVVIPVLKAVKTYCKYPKIGEIITKTICNAEIEDMEFISNIYRNKIVKRSIVKNYPKMGKKIIEKIYNVAKSTKDENSVIQTVNSWEQD